MAFGVQTGGLDFAKEAVKGAPAFKPQPHKNPFASIGDKSGASSSGVSWNGDKINPAVDEGDIAILSSTAVSLPETVSAPQLSTASKPITINGDVLKELYANAFRGSHSHNQMHERFFQGMASNALVGLMSLVGISPKEIQFIQYEVRQEALAQIDGKITTDYCRAKIEIGLFG